MPSTRVYICHTYYHVLISMIKEISKKKDADIVICDTIPKYQELMNSLNKAKIFNNVFFFSELKYKNNARKIHPKKHEILLANYKFKKLINPNFEFNQNTYEEVNIYNDWTYFGYYLRANRIYYNLLEDAKDSYKVLDSYVKINYHKNFIQKIFGFALETLYFHGKSKYSNIIEVNDHLGLRIPKEKIRICKKQEMFDKLTLEQKDKIYKVFSREKDLADIVNLKSVLILTQPLFEDRMVQTKEHQKEVYQNIIDTHCTALNIVIKPHPRDNFNYDGEFKNVSVMDKNLPTEILNFNTNIKFSKAITVSSSSINGINFVDEKIYLGFDWLKKYQ